MCLAGGHSEPGKDGNMGMEPSVTEARGQPDTQALDPLN